MKITDIKYSMITPRLGAFDIFIGSGIVDRTIHSCIINVSNELTESENFDEVMKDKIKHELTAHLAGER